MGVRSILAGIAMVLWASIAQAGEFAERAVIGFSSDGRYFAFEEFGQQDGSGFVYSSIFVVDTRERAWVRGTPFRVVIEDENQPISAARKRAARDAARTLERLKITEPGHLLAANPLTERETNFDRVVISRHAMPASDGNRWHTPYGRVVFSLADFTTNETRCAEFGVERLAGFALRMVDDDGRRTLIHRDARVPQSRGCALGYAISDIIGFDPPDATTARLYVVLVSVFQFGFEGPDRRFIAVPHWTN